ncbi:MAG: hypothetical protein IJU79_05860 [Desulfovibrionaceae bacterium]|nr:hypothetical protein [Desulfovibrionaceae bacterium]
MGAQALFRVGDERRANRSAKIGQEQLSNGMCSSRLGCDSFFSRHAA